MKYPPMLNAYELRCPSCGSANISIRQVGHFVNTLLLLCRDENRAHNFIGPTVESK